MTYTLEINHERRDVNAPAGTSLLTVLRDDMRLTGAKFGCGHGQCGACVVLVDGEPVPACTAAIEEIGERSVVTIEGLATGERLHPVQRAFLDEGALQCGYCTSGMILAAVALLERLPSPNNVEIRDALAPHLCRCGVYQRAIRAVQRAAHEARQ
jgi:aerobic-type carbon monoxide dehydrogenase small subunit (CoxS/CutS family)